MMGWTLLSPACHEGSGIKREANAAIGIADVKGWSGEALALRHQEFQRIISILRYTEHRDRAEPDLEFDRNAKAALAMIELELAQNRPLLRNGDMTRTVVSQQHKLFFQVHRVNLGIAAASVQAIHDEHGNRIFQIALAATGDAPGG